MTDNSFNWVTLLVTPPLVYFVIGAAVLLILVWAKK